MSLGGRRFGLEDLPKALDCVLFDFTKWKELLTSKAFLQHFPPIIFLCFLLCILLFLLRLNFIIFIFYFLNTKCFQFLIPLFLHLLIRCFSHPPHRSSFRRELSSLGIICQIMWIFPWIWNWRIANYQFCQGF